MEEIATAPKRSIVSLENLFLKAITNMKEPGGAIKTAIASYIEQEKQRMGGLLLDLFTEASLAKMASHLFFPGSNPMLGYRQAAANAQQGKYVWLTYKEVYDIVIKAGASIRVCGINKGGRCGFYCVNCPKCVMSMEAGHAHGLHCVPLYDSLGAGAVEYILCHAKVSIVFVEEKKISEVLKTLPNTKKYLTTIVSFAKVKADKKEDGESFGLAIYSWDEFLQLVCQNQDYTCSPVLLQIN